MLIHPCEKKNACTTKISDTNTDAYVDVHSERTLGNTHCILCRKINKKKIVPMLWTSYKEILKPLHLHTLHKFIKPAGVLEVLDFFTLTHYNWLPVLSIPILTPGCASQVVPCTLEVNILPIITEWHYDKICLKVNGFTSKGGEYSHFRLCAFL